MLFIENDSSSRVLVPHLDGLLPVEALGQRHHVLAVVDLEGATTMVVNAVGVDVVLKLPLTALSTLFLSLRGMFSLHDVMSRHRRGTVLSLRTLVFRCWVALLAHPVLRRVPFVVIDPSSS